MKKFLYLKLIILIFGLTLFSSCSAVLSSASVTANSPDITTNCETNTASPEVFEDLSTRAESFALPYIEAALAALESSPRNDLSAVTYEFEDEYSYAGPTEEQINQYGSGSDNENLDSGVFLDAVCDVVVKNMPQDASAYDKYRYLAYFLSLATDYDTKGTGGLMDITPYGAIIEGRSICLGYSTAYLYLCEKADLWCRPVYGYSENGIHGWDLVKLEDGTYYVDVTWCDGLGQIGTEDWQSYFMLTETVLLEDHGILNGDPATGQTIFD